MAPLSDRNRKILDLIEQDKTNAEVVAAMSGLTLGAVAGVIHRHGHLLSKIAKLQRKSRHNPNVKPLPADADNVDRIGTILGLSSGPPPKTCQWPLGHPGQDGFRFCGGKVVPGKPYCAAHCEVAYRKPSDAEEKLLNV